MRTEFSRLFAFKNNHTRYHLAMMKTFHVNLGNLNSKSQHFLNVGGHSFPLKAHTEETLNALEPWHVLRWAGGTGTKATHFCHVDAHAFGAGGVQIIQLNKKDKASPMGQLVRLSYHIDEEALKNYFTHKLRKLRNNQTGGPSESGKGISSVITAALEAKGVTHLPEDEDTAIKLLVSTNSIVDEQSTASALVSLSPQLLTTSPAVATTILHEHILCDSSTDPQQAHAMNRLTTALEEAGEDWCPNVPCTDQNGQQITADYDFGSEETGWKKGQLMLRADPSEEVYTYVKDPLLRATQTASNNQALAGQVWHGTIGQVLEPTSQSALNDANPSHWTLSSYSSQHGIRVAAESISFKDDILSLNVSNRHQRTLFAGYQLRDADGNKLGTAKELDQITTVDHFAGIPLPTDPTELKIRMVASIDSTEVKASQVELIFGSLGIGDWEEPFSRKGAYSTGIWQLAVPVILLALGSWFKTTRTYRDIMDSPKLKATLAAAAAALGEKFKGTEWTLKFFRNQGLGFLAQKGFEELAIFLAERAGETLAFEAAMGPAGMLYAAAGYLANVSDLTVTTCECLTSPATVRVTVKHMVDVKVGINPGPNRRPWPETGKRWRAELNIQGRAGQFCVGDLLHHKPSETIPLNFTDVPYGAIIQVGFFVETENGWIAGQVHSETVTAIPQMGEVMEMPPLSIVENLIPLTKDSQYEYAGKSVIVEGNPQWSGVEDKPSQKVGSNRTSIAFGFDPFRQAVLMSWWGSSGTNVMWFDRIDASGYVITAEGRGQLMTAPSCWTHADDKYVSFDGQWIFPLNPQGFPDDLRYTPASAYAKIENPKTYFPALLNVKGEAAVLLDQTNNKLLVAPLNKTYPLKVAPQPLILSGKGSRQGLVDGLVEGAVASDGRILVLEQDNSRVQAFDSCGNPVQCFASGVVVGEVGLEEWKNATSAADKVEVLADVLKRDLQTDCKGFWAPTGAARQMDQGIYSDADSLVLAFRAAGVEFAYDPEDLKDPTKSTQIETVLTGKMWNLRDPRGMIWRVAVAEEVKDLPWVAYLIPSQPEVTEVTANTHWQVRDAMLGLAWDLSISPTSGDKLYVRPLRSYFEVYVAYRDALFLDVAVESKGYIYVLGYYNASAGPKPENYFVKVYEPMGGLLFETPKEGALKDQHIVADKLFVEGFRTLYAMSYDSIRKYQSDKVIEMAQITKWTPSPPPKQGECLA